LSAQNIKIRYVETHFGRV